MNDISIAESVLLAETFEQLYNALPLGDQFWWCCERSEMLSTFNERYAPFIEVKRMYGGDPNTDIFQVRLFIDYLYTGDEFSVSEYLNDLDSNYYISKYSKKEHRKKFVLHRNESLKKPYDKVLCYEDCEE